MSNSRNKLIDKDSKLDSNSILNMNNVSVFDKLTKDEILNYLAVNVTMEYYFNDKPNDFMRLQSRIEDIAYFIRHGRFKD